MLSSNILFDEGQGLPLGGSEVLLVWELFYWVKGTWEGVIWQFEPFSKLKTAFCEYWTPIKIKINMTSLCKEYEIKTKMEQEQWLLLKMKFLLGYNLKIVA